jgi:gliding motility-associated lipoprotein GldB
MRFYLSIFANLKLKIVKIRGNPMRAGAFMKKISFVILILYLCLLQSCNQTEDIKPEIRDMHIQIEFVRFDSIFSRTEPNDFEKLKASYPFMFQNNIPDSLWKLKMVDTLQNEIETEVSKKFSDFLDYKKAIKLFFKHLKYYFPSESLPDKVVTLAEFVDYKTKVIRNDSLLFISLDNYLGEEHRFYEGFQKYISSLQASHQILPDVAEQYAKKLVPLSSNRDLMSQMIYEGKVLYFKERMLPGVEEFHLIGYDKKQYEWSITYETMIWQYFIERDLLYSTQSDLRRRFLKPGPFTKFYLEIDDETPPRLGQYLGWQIVRAYADRFPEKSVKDIINTDAQILFSQSKYKP